MSIRTYPPRREALRGPAIPLTLLGSEFFFSPAAKFSEETPWGLRVTCEGRCKDPGGLGAFFSLLQAFYLPLPGKSLHQGSRCPSLAQARLSPGPA